MTDATSPSGPGPQSWDYLELGHIRSTLIRQEDTILFNLIERAQFKRNSPIYQTGAEFLAGTDIKEPFVKHLLRETECSHAKARRYTSPDEKPFTPRSELPAPVLPAQKTPDRLKYLVDIDINYSEQILKMYEEEVLPLICKEGDDGQYGSSAVCDIQALQALSKRIHYGTFVAESKFLAQTEEYTKLIKAGDRAGIMELLTNKEVEERVIKRVQNKAMAYGQEITDETSIGSLFFVLIFLILVIFLIFVKIMRKARTHQHTLADSHARVETERESACERMRASGRDPLAP
jgi:chorismate mutase